MKIRIGVGMGAAGASEPEAFAATVQQMERLRFDSLWLSEVLTGLVVDPLAGLAYAAGITRKLKLGTTMTVTARNPIRMAKELATIDRLSGGRRARRLDRRGFAAGAAAMVRRFGVAQGPAAVLPGAEPAPTTCPGSA